MPNPLFSLFWNKVLLCRLGLASKLWFSWLNLPYTAAILGMQHYAWPDEEKKIVPITSLHHYLLSVSTWTTTTMQNLRIQLKIGLVVVRCWRFSSVVQPLPTKRKAEFNLQHPLQNQPINSPTHPSRARSPAPKTNKNEKQKTTIKPEHWDYSLAVDNLLLCWDPEFNPQ